MAGGYGASSASGNTKWMLNTVWWPGSLTEDETFLWYSVNPRLTVGTAYLLKQKAFRALGSYLLSPETATLPSTHISAGVQGIGTGNPGYSFTSEKNWDVNGTGVNIFLGVGYRTNRKILRGVGGFKLSRGQLTVGYQNDGVEQYPFATISFGQWSTGFYLIGFKSPAYILGVRF
ncbi:MAG TPA: hypothetical protein PLX06_05405 [Fimbriimonadaceae bacterium]|nr:hypothetical protein [Fimbriimonadaceae bacterium]